MVVISMADKIIHGTLDEQTAQQFEELMSTYKINSRMGLLRFLVNQEYRKQHPEAITPVQPSSYSPVSH